MNSHKSKIIQEATMKKIFCIFILALIFTHFAYETDGPNVWTTTTTSVGRVLALAVDPVTQTTMYCGSLDSGVMKSTNGGVNWIGVNSGMTYNHVQSLAVSPSNPSIIYAGTDSLGGANSGLYRSTNAGVSWTLCPTNAAQRSFQYIVIHPTNPNIVLVGVFNALANSTHGIYRTTDGGVTWAPSTTGLGANKNILSLAINPLNGNVVYAGTSLDPVAATGPSFIYRSNDAGATWFLSSTGLPSTTADNNPVREMKVSRADTGVVLAALFFNSTTGGAWVSTNGGGSWTQRITGLPAVAGNLLRACFIRPGSSTEFYLGIDNATTGGVYRSTNAGLTWSVFNGGSVLTNYATRSFTFRTSPDSTLYTGVGSTAIINPPGMGIYEFTFTPVGINDPNSQLPNTFNLEQNYPNPFNPSTVISYSVPSQSFVTIKVYDLSGSEVKTLVSETRAAGNHQVTFTGDGLSSGVYLYKLSAGNYTETKKMILIK
jgi:photosystem II stability/assembly factor-like uncharacterized protein